MSLVWSPGRKLGARTLRLGDKGIDVNKLHELLRDQGYDLGNEQMYGYLTKDAVRQFQRDHGLVADGIAGKRFFALALKENPPIRRRVHVVEPKETLEAIAQRYQVGPEAFGRSSRRQTVYPGQRLVFFDREIWGICENGLQESVSRQALTGLVSFHPSTTSHQLCMIGVNSQASTDLRQLHHLLQTPLRRRRAVQHLLEPVPGGCGLYMAWKEVPALDGARYLKLLKRLRRNLPAPALLWVELGPNIPSWRVWGGLDYRRVNELVDRVVMEVPLPAKPGPLFDREATEALIGTLLQDIHSWKLLLRVPVYALEWELDGENTSKIRLGYQTALSRAFRHGARLREDEDRGLYYAYRKKGIDYHLRLPHHSSMATLAAMCNRHNLAGIIIDELGMEDPRIWSTLSSHFHTASLNISQE